MFGFYKMRMLVPGFKIILAQASACASMLCFGMRNIDRIDNILKPSIIDFCQSSPRWADSVTSNVTLTEDAAPN